MISEQYDMVIIGAGLAGLSTARTAARLGFYTLIIERQDAPGSALSGEYAMIVPAPDLVSARPFLDGMIYPQIDLWIPEHLITTAETVQRCFSPAGYEFQTIFADDENGPAVMVNKVGLLNLMMEQATSAGAEFLFGVEATGLLYEDDRVVGVQTSAGDIRAEVVICTEGAPGALAEAAGLLPRTPRRQRHELMLTLELDAPAVREEHLGQIVVLGQKTAWSAQGYATLLMPAAGRAQLTFGGLTDLVSCAAGAAAEEYLAACGDDPRVAHLLEGASVITQTLRAAPHGSVPNSLAREGFIMAGDVVAPTGQLGILPAIYLGRQAALFAAEMLDDADNLAETLAEYDQVCRARVIPALDVESRTTQTLFDLTDAELNRLALLLNSFHLPIPFMGRRLQVPWSTVDGLAHNLGLAAEDCDLLQRVLGADNPALALITGQPMKASYAANVVPA